MPKNKKKQNMQSLGVTRLLTFIANGNLLLLSMLIFIPLIFFAKLFLLVIIGVDSYSSVLDQLVTNTPCFLNTSDFLLLQSLKLHTNNVATGVFLQVIDDYGFKGMASDYLLLSMSVMLAQIASAAWLYKKNKYLLKKVNILTFSKMALISAMVMLWGVCVYNFFNDVHKITNYQNTTEQAFSRAIKNKVNLGNGDIKNMMYGDLAGTLGIDKEIVNYCTFSNNVHYLKDGQKAYITLH